MSQGGVWRGQPTACALVCCRFLPAFLSASQGSPPPAPPLCVVQVLLAERQYQEARELLQAALDVCGKRCALVERCCCCSQQCCCCCCPQRCCSCSRRCCSCPRRCCCCSLLLLAAVGALAHTPYLCVECRWTDKWKKDAVRVLLFEAALGQRDFAAALASLRPVANRWPRSPLVWNGFSRWAGTQRADRKRQPTLACSCFTGARRACCAAHAAEVALLPSCWPPPTPSAPPTPPHPHTHRYLTETGGVRAAQRMLQPLRSRHPACLPLMLLMGHCHLLNTQYSEALAEYFHAYR